MLTDFNILNTENIQNTLLKDYLLIKNEHPDFIVLFQIGEFYETLFQDARIFSDITGATISRRIIKDIGPIQQAGVNISSVNLYIKKLLSENHKICLCNEYIDENNERRRKLIRKYTQGTILENEFLSSDENNFIAVLYKQKEECFLAYADVSTGQFYKTKCEFKEAIHEIEKICPSEILIAQNQKEIFKSLNKFNITFINPNLVSAEFIENTIISYCEETQKNYIVKLNNVTEYKIEKYLSMDNVTRKNLELTRTKRFSKKKGSLIWFVNHTSTPMGTRLLKKYINEPLKYKEEIIKRQNAIEEIIKTKKQEKLSLILGKICDISRICAKLSNKTILPKGLLLISQNSEVLKELNNLCESFSSPLLKINSKELEISISLADKIEKAIDEEAPNDIKDGSVIKDGFDSNLDYLRTKLLSAEKNLEKYEQKQQLSLNLAKLKINYTKMFGYVFEIPLNLENKIPREFNKVQKLSSCLRYKTEELKTYEETILNLKYKIIEIECALYEEIKKDMATFTQTIRTLANDVALIDVLNSLAICADKNKLIKPKFNNEKIDIKDGYHPSLLCANTEIITNDTYLENGNMIILTGANMSGKSTYLKHNALINLLSQIGSYVPAQSANLTITDKIFLRQGSTDDILNNNSSFMIEMDDLKTILDNATENSLVLLDEPAKSTSSKEGGALARAFCEYLAEHNKPKTIIATHNWELTKLENQYPNQIHNFTTGENSTNTINRKIKKGITKTSQAINTAQLANLPKEIIEKAKSYLES